MTANSYLEVNTSALRSNAESILASLAPGAKLVPVLKGNAYGLGAVPAARLLAELPEIDTFAVSHVSEGLALREAGIREEIWVMSLPPDGLYEAAAERDLTLTLASFRQLELLRSLSKRLGRPVKVQLKLDTGLHRIGFPESELPELAAALPAYASCLRICGTFSTLRTMCRSIWTGSLPAFSAVLRVWKMPASRRGSAPSPARLRWNGAIGMTLTPSASGGGSIWTIRLPLPAALRRCLLCARI